MTRSIGETSRRLLAPWLVAILLLPVAAAGKKAPPPEPGPNPITSRMVIEKQLAARSAKSGASMGAAEARRIHDRYLSRIGTPLEAENDAASGRGRQ